MEKEKAKKAIQKGNLEGARIHAENAIRQKNQGLNYLRMSARVDAVSSRVQTALTTRKVSCPITSIIFAHIEHNTQEIMYNLCNVVPLYNNHMSKGPNARQCHGIVVL